MNRKVHLLLLLSFYFHLSTVQAQAERPSVIYQSSMQADPEATFHFSSGNRYFIGYNITGEYVIWDMQSGQQIKKISAPVLLTPSLYYTVNPDFSNDERYLLIPEFPKGNYWLYDLKRDSVLNTFIPPKTEEGECYTHAKFSEDGALILLLSQSPGDNKDCVVRIVDRTGKVLKVCYMAIPRPLQNETIIRLIFNKAYRFLKSGLLLTNIIASPNLDEVFFSSTAGKVYKLNLASRSFNTNANETELETLKGVFGHPEIKALKYYEGKLILQRKETQTKMADKKRWLVQDSIFIINPQTMQSEGFRISKFILDPAKHSNSVSLNNFSANNYLNVYLDTEPGKNDEQDVVFKNVLSSQKLFSYPRGEPFFWYTKGEYQQDNLNGGAIIAVSEDHKYVAACTRDIIIYDVEHRKIKFQFSPVRGMMKLNQPIFIDSSRILIPKIHPDAFVLDLKTANVGRLKREVDCQDTVRNGANSFFAIDVSAQMGLQNVTVSKNENRIAITNYIPNDLCSGGNNKIIDVYSIDNLEKQSSFTFYDREYTNRLNVVTGYDKKFLVNYKLVDFLNADKPSIIDLKFIQKKDTFYAMNPVYLPSTKSIFSILGTRARPGNPDLIFAHFSLEGKLLNSFRYKRQKTKLEFQTFIFESQLSPDSSRLLFGIHDGMVGVFDIASMKIVHLVEHGKAYDVNYLDYHNHTMVISGCFLDSNHFASCGNDGLINIWEMGIDKPIRSIKLPDTYLLYGLGLSPDKRYLFGTDIDKNIVFINVATGQRDLLFTAFNYEGYAITSKDGYYTSNKKSNNELAFRFKGRFYEFSQFDLALNRPDKILEQMGYATPEFITYYRKAYEKRIEKLKYKPLSLEQLNDYSAPEITLSGLPGEATTEASSISFDVSATSGTDPVNRLFVSVNGVPLFGTVGKPIKTDSKVSATIPVQVPLSNGHNRIVVSVMSKNGVESLREHLSINRKPLAKPNLYIIAIGSGQFIDKTKNLQYASKDASDVLNLFDSKVSDYGKINKSLLINENVTRQSVMKLKEQLKSSRPDDLVILYYAGHGILDDKLNYYLSTYGTDFAKPAAKAIVYDDLEGMLDSIPSRNKMLLIDACHSGEFDKENMTQYYQDKTSTGEILLRNASKRSVQEKSIGLANSFQLMQTLFTDMRRSSGCSVIASAGGAEYAVEGEHWKNGVFTYCLQIGLKEKSADLNKDGIIQLSELVEFLKFRVSELTNDKQKPTSRTENIVNDIRIW